MKLPSLRSDSSSCCHRCVVLSWCHCQRTLLLELIMANHCDFSANHTLGL
ncbi:hypothetical protein MtrunA17_Chr8g0373871 [Medicago truncatula]|uniref:Uncharacterized protein n=1 Tax=Medicago truncatula TaxID=3880 RepID=A0A396GRN2_MEDTR|nr:hypothetical protein MtrunA17_Chr8g0373871 [Medicago truncatula]